MARTKKKPISQKTPFSLTFMYLAVTLVMLASFGMCIISSLTQYYVKDVWFFQTTGVGAIMFIVGFLTGENVKQK